MNCSSCATPLAPQATICGTCGRLVEDPLVGTMLNDRYRIQAKLAVGGFGAIYRGVQVTNNRKVAIKVMHRELSADDHLVARFRREGAALCSLRDAHSVTTYELDETADGRLFIVMELLEGRNLLELFRASGPLPWRRVFAIARSVCSALAEAHELGIVHRDLKPANIFLEERHGGDDFVKVLDFGIAKIMRGSGIDDGSELTITGQAVGTLEYMAPEQLIGGKCDGRTDIYTLGVVAYEMITGRRPFATAGIMDLLATQLAEKAPPPSLFVPLPAAVTKILMRCLERDESARYADVTQLATAIDEVLAQSDMELLATRTATVKGVGAPKNLGSSPAVQLAPVPSSGPYAFEAPPARRLIEEEDTLHAPIPVPDASHPAMPAPGGSHAAAPAPRASHAAMPGPAPGPLPLAAIAAMPDTIPEVPVHRPSVPRRPRTSALRIIVWMTVLAGAGVGVGMLIAELGI